MTRICFSPHAVLVVRKVWEIYVYFDDLPPTTLLRRNVVSLIRIYIFLYILKLVLKLPLAMSMETEKTEKEKEDEKEVEKKLVAPRLVHEVDGQTRRELKLFNWELRRKVWRLRVAFVLHPCEGEENYFTEFNALGKPIAVRAKSNGGFVSVPPTSTITCIIIRCSLKVSVPRKVLDALGGANPFTETKKNIGWRVELGLFFQRRPRRVGP